MRRATQRDIPAVEKALARMVATSPAAQMKFADIETAVSYIEFAIRQDMAWIMGKYLILVDVGSVWYSPARFLIEQIILKLDIEDAAVNLDTVVRNGLSYLRDYHNCDAIVAGDTQIGMMVPRYIAAGFVPIGTQLLKG
jgi:hypothetical protein